MSGLWNSTLGSAGSIDTHAQALVGPNIGGVTTGYNPLIFNPAVAGEHWIEFYRSNDGGVTPLLTAVSYTHLDVYKRQHQDYLKKYPKNEVYLVMGLFHLQLLAKLLR